MFWFKHKLIMRHLVLHFQAFCQSKNIFIDVYWKTKSQMSKYKYTYTYNYINVKWKSLYRLNSGVTYQIFLIFFLNERVYHGEGSYERKL